MCGIFGLLQKQSSAPAPSEAKLRESAARMSHRGPDGHGIHSDRAIGLAHARLSLVDLHVRSNQPFADATGRYVLVYNGELYDYAGLRSELQERGVQFRTTSDTEVLLESLIHFGVDATIRKIEGMFAFGFVDSVEQTLVIARDRFGIKPLYFHDGSDAFVFASSVDAMRPWIELQPDRGMVESFLHAFPGPTAGRSFYQGVSLVPPGAVVHVGVGRCTQLSQLLAMNDFIDDHMAAAFASRSDNDLVDEAEQLLLQGVKTQLEADVPVGAFCSGGVDSSLVLAMAARSHSDLRVFHADIVGPLSEHSAAAHLSRHLKLDLKAVPVLDQDFISTLPEVMHHFGFPFSNPTSVPLLRVSQLVRDNNIKAVLCGEGSDECYLGYSWLSRDILASIRGLPKRVARKLVGPKPILDASARDSALIGNLANNFERIVGPTTYDNEAGVARKKAVSQGLAVDPELSYILRSLLLRNDAMGMAASVEARFPFLDSRLVKFSVNLPERCKIRFSPTATDGKHLFYQDKWIIRQVAARYLPWRLSSRPKGQFPTNAFQRMRIAPELFGDAFGAELLGVSGDRLTYFVRNASRSLQLRLMLLQSWWKICILNHTRNSVRSEIMKHTKVDPL